MSKAKITEFIDNWRGRGYEKGESQTFWLELLTKVLGVDDPFRIISFEGQVKELNKTSFMDAYIGPTKVLIEQKSVSKDLSAAILQSDGQMLTPYQQAKKYVAEMPLSRHPRWVVTCNFREFRIYDMEHPQADPEIVLLEDLATEYYRLQFLVDTGNAHVRKEMEVSLKAGEIIGEIYDALLKEYHSPDDPETLRSLNVLCVRLVFCLYAEDSGLFATRSAFHDYLARFKPGTGDMRRALMDLFDILNTPVQSRDPYLSDELNAFPYVNGGLFERRDIEIPRFNDSIAELLLKHASDDFDWSQISPTIFGAVFESTLNPQTRRKGGMHYTSVENIHKVIDPLFLDDLKGEFNEIMGVRKDQIRRLLAFQRKLASLKFLDPACGSGNFLTETYLSLRRLENEVIRVLSQGNMLIEFGDDSWIKVGIRQFYGIEINDFAVATATTALWIAEAQMMRETEAILNMEMDFLPLKSYANIVEGNALRMDWNEVVPAAELDYIMGNPPFVGYSFQSKEQKDDIRALYVDQDGRPYKASGKMDYVAGWFWKASALMSGTDIKAAFVSTNSICQGEQVSAVWKPLADRFGIHIDFAWKTFVWDSEASSKAHVHCVIVGFSPFVSYEKGIVFDGDERLPYDSINFYLVEGKNLFIESRTRPLCDVPYMVTGNRPADGGHLIIEGEQYCQFVKSQPEALPYIRRLVGSSEFINGHERYCLWLKDVSPAVINRIPLVRERVRLCREDRLQSPDEGRRRLADKAHLFRETLNPESYVVVPATSSERRRYVPMGFLDSSCIPTNAVLVIPEAGLFHLGVLQSHVHMAWMRTVCGRLKSDYRYSKDLVYNNFPWPEPTDSQKGRIEKTAQSILDARGLYPDCSLADLYDEVTMPVELRKAHQANDRAVMEAYGFRQDMKEEEIVAALFRMYQMLSDSDVSISGRI